MSKTLKSTPLEKPMRAAESGDSCNAIGEKYGNFHFSLASLLGIKLEFFYHSELIANICFAMRALPSGKMFTYSE